MSNEESSPENKPSGDGPQRTRRRRRKPRSGEKKGGGGGGQNNRGGGGQNNRGGGGGQSNRGGRGSKAGGGRRRRRGGRGKQQDKRIDISQIDPERPIEELVGFYEPSNDGNGYLRAVINYYLPDAEDPIIPASLIFEYRIREGSMLVVDVAMPNEQGQKPTVVKIYKINDKEPEDHKGEVAFKALMPCDPEVRYRLETDKDPDISMRIIDLLTPIGMGQRALIVAPPRTGKTIILQKMCNAITERNPGVVVIVLLIDERPEEVTDMKRNTSAEVIASCLDEGSANHVRVTEIVLEKVRRLVEAGQDVVVLLDSITRLGRAYNNETKHSGRILSGGVDAKTLAKPKAFFGAARNIEDGGSLTIIATALIDTGSRMDQVIFEEFKGTGNMELLLSRQLANNRIFPAIDIVASGTRKEEKLMPEGELQKVNVLRRVLNQMNPNEAMRLLIDRMEKTESNTEFLARFDVSD